MNYCKITGNKLRTAAEDVDYWAQQNEALRVRIVGMPKAEALAFCHKLLAADYIGWSSKDVAKAFLKAI